ncbi:hypothetical protein BS78_10G010300 [Paspalum vaginatum]|nr:hypothetical protein BS78_10G010300 [Paspalum vaginatum]
MSKALDFSIAKFGLFHPSYRQRPRPFLPDGSASGAVPFSSSSSGGIRCATRRRPPPAVRLSRQPDPSRLLPRLSTGPHLDFGLVCLLENLAQDVGLFLLVSLRPSIEKKKGLRPKPVASSILHHYSNCPSLCL